MNALQEARFRMRRGMPAPLAIAATAAKRGLSTHALAVQLGRRSHRSARRAVVAAAGTPAAEPWWNR